MSDIDYIALTKLCHTNCQFHQVICTNSNTFISIPIFGLCLCRDASNNEDGLDIDSSSSLNVKLIAKGSNIFNSNTRDGIYVRVDESTNFVIDVQDGGSIQSCGNGDDDIYTEDCSGSSVAFTGSGSYTCEKVDSYDSGTIVGPNCQACP